DSLETAIAFLLLGRSRMLLFGDAGRLFRATEAYGHREGLPLPPDFELRLEVGSPKRNPIPEVREGIHRLSIQRQDDVPRSKTRLVRAALGKDIGDEDASGRGSFDRLRELWVHVLGQDPEVAPVNFSPK